MFILHLETNAAEKDLLIAELWERGTAGVTEQNVPGGGCTLAAYFEHRFDASEFAAYNPRWEAAENRDWIAVAQSLWTPVLVGSRFYLAPAWSDEPAPPGRFRIDMDPGQAFGTGWHTSTQLCLEAMERCVRPGDSVLDVGTGTGILCLAASLLGASPIYACDIDPAAVASASARFRSGGVPVGLFTGSVRSVRDAAADVIVANINAETLMALAPEICRIRKPQGRAILSGFSVRDAERVRRAFGGCSETLEKEDWAALVCLSPA
ncbi:MAG TPA: 50S ribosomal protein L11 methyltransferase [Bryobacteraceae bacterium]|nr:50S ribosomal protein L11 methyltransferase [Bryobacteraceae bacterium]HOQ47227.1 50S ribosomal protein L11 methyltransferase [Bryobacteraceae bacterium]HPQ14383.1 50S ribosomal protein L11 methyltransferase [Bryobacteraceae bacterium]HPU74105.1 50S ribosomal protein L11 methyltransferase [Bryobacteraceae bacterium]